MVNSSETNTLEEPDAGLFGFAFNSSISASIIIFSNNSLMINFPDSTYIDLWCNNQDIGVVIEYYPGAQDTISNIEWYSTDNR